MHLLRQAFQRAMVMVVCLVGAASAQAQTCSIPGQAGSATVAAQPNTFFPGTTNVAAGATALTVGAGRGVNSGIAAGDLLLIIQMQGADINQTNSNSYGAGNSSPGVTNTVAFGTPGYAGGNSATNFLAGNYEWAVASGGNAAFAGGGTINLSAPLLNAYANRAGSTTTGKQAFQVIRVPQYANVTVGAALSVLPWNGSTGGVLAMDAAGSINLGAQVINGSGRGFRGAGAATVTPNAVCTAASTTTGCQEYVATIAGGLGGSKGEGLAGTPARIYNDDPTGAGNGVLAIGTADGYVNGETARGAPGNAGGGGNQHNAGGGGGGNGGAGGTGGNSWNSSDVNFAGLRLGGFGGSPSGNLANKWIMGGAGGAGDVGGNTATAPDGSGGAGGALVVLRASRINSSGAIINVNGAPGIAARATDAAGGGGAGGTVVLATGAGGLAGGLTVNAAGGAGGNFNPVGNEQDGSGGGGGGGVLISNVGGTTFNAPGGAAGTSSSLACPPARPGANCGQTAGFATAGTVGYSIASPGVRVGYECLPNLVVTKATSTPVVTSSTGAQASYTVVITNSGGGARFVNMHDFALPPGWTRAATAPTYSYFPAQPLAAGNLSSGAETIAPIEASTWSVGAVPLTVPAAGVTTLTWTSFALAPLRAGVPSAVSITFAVNVPDAAAVGTYHNGAGVSFLDSTRSAASTRTVAPLVNVAENRTAASYGPTTYASYNGGAATTVGGSHYSGLQAGPTNEDVRLVADFSISKAASASAAPGGGTIAYTITPRNNGRAIGPQAFATSQASDVAIANVPAVLGSSPVTVTDTLPAGVTATSAFTGTGWTCSAANPAVCTLADANAYPVAAATNFPVINGTATVTLTCPTASPALTNTAVVSSAQGETVTANNTATAVTTAACINANLSVVKTNAVATVAAGSTTSYTLTFANNGPGAGDGSLVRDTPAAGLNCTAVTCTATTGGAVCPAPGAAAGQLSIANLLPPGAGVRLPTLPPNSTLNLAVTCGVTATGQP